jgi:hypothetical protein
MHVQTLNIGMHIQVISTSLYKIVHIYFSTQNNGYDLISVLAVNNL